MEEAPKDRYLHLSRQLAKIDEDVANSLARKINELDTEWYAMSVDDKWHACHKLSERDH